jgi:hypothetical protein
VPHGKRAEKTGGARSVKASVVSPLMQDAQRKDEGCDIVGLFETTQNNPSLRTEAVPA